jgi:hypothetical protein
MGVTSSLLLDMFIVTKVASGTKPPQDDILHYGIHICEIHHEYFLLSLREGFLLALVEFEEGLYA